MSNEAPKEIGIVPYRGLDRSEGYRLVSSIYWSKPKVILYILKSEALALVAAERIGALRDALTVVPDHWTSGSKIRERILVLMAEAQPKTPCGECHIQPGETCDICGAHNDFETPPTPKPPLRP